MDVTISFIPLKECLENIEKDDYYLDTIISLVYYDEFGLLDDFPGGKKYKEKLDNIIQYSTMHTKTNVKYCVLFFKMIMESNTIKLSQKFQFGEKKETEAFYDMSNSMLGNGQEFIEYGPELKILLDSFRACDPLKDIDPEKRQSFLEDYNIYPIDREKYIYIDEVLNGVNVFFKLKDKEYNLYAKKNAGNAYDLFVNNRIENIDISCGILPHGRIPKTHIIERILTWEMIFDGRK